jgi:uncharacterized phage protein (TIGR01671 family)
MGMREILFRGKAVNLHNGSKDFVYGQYVKNRGGKMIYSDTWEYGIQKHYVIEETVGQYTGLTDKNGKKIFEGDIVAGALYWQETPKNGVVAFREGSFGLIWYRGEIEQFNAFSSMCNITYEVVGNTHDNPELLNR